MQMQVHLCLICFVIMQMLHECVCEECFVLLHAGTLSCLIFAPFDSLVCIFQLLLKTDGIDTHILFCLVLVCCSKVLVLISIRTFSWQLWLFHLKPKTQLALLT